MLRHAACRKKNSAYGIAKNMHDIPNDSNMFNTLFGNRNSKLKNGKWKEFNKHAILIAEGNYLQGRKHGHWKEYYDTGEMMIEENYQDDVPQGRYAIYHRNGNLLSEGQFVNGSREGYFR